MFGQYSARTTAVPVPQPAVIVNEQPPSNGELKSLQKIPDLTSVLNHMMDDRESPIPFQSSPIRFVGQGCPASL